MHKSISSHTLSTVDSSISHSESSSCDDSMMIRRRYFRSLGVISSKKSPGDALGHNQPIHTNLQSSTKKYQSLRECDVKASYEKPLADSVCNNGDSVVSKSPTGVAQFYIKNRSDAQMQSGMAVLKSSGKGGSVSFNPRVKVVPIPERRSYSARARNVLWNTAHTLRCNVERNIVEYSFDGWYWRDCLEETDMYICSNSGETIHPAHLHMDSIR